MPDLLQHAALWLDCALTIFAARNGFAVSELRSKKPALPSLIATVVRFTVWSLAKVCAPVVAVQRMVKHRVDVKERLIRMRRRRDQGAAGREVPSALAAATPPADVPYENSWLIQQRDAA
jgi:hypothetical protein